MIDRDEFKNTWAHLCERFRRPNDTKQSAAYYVFLNEQMDTGEFLKAARAIWATSKYFPRPADFLLVSAGNDWRHLLAAIEECKPPEWSWKKHYDQLSDRARSACEQLGGIHAMRTVFDKDVLRLKSAWERAYEQAAADAVLALPPPRNSSRNLLPVA